MIFHEGTTHLDSLIDGTEFAGAVACHEERVGIVILVSGRCADSREHGSGKKQ